MWIIELNIAGYQFTASKRRPFRFSPRRNLHWPVLRHSHAA